MSASQNTTNYGFPKFLGTDKPAWLVDFNGAMDDIDSTIKTVADLLATLDGTVQTNTGDISQLVTDLESASGDITALQSLVATNIANIATKAPIANPNFTGEISLNGNPLAISAMVNAIINGGFNINQRAVSGTVVLTAGQYGHDRWKAGASGCTYTFNTVENVTTITIISGSLIQVIEGINLETGTYVLSWLGNAQGKIGAGAYADSGVTGSVTGGSNLSIEFGIGTISKVRLNMGSSPMEWQQNAYDDVLRQCQRYYQRLGGSSVNEVLGHAYSGVSLTNMEGMIKFIVPMRIVPTNIEYANLSVLLPTKTFYSISSVALNTGATGKDSAYLTVITTNGTANSVYVLTTNSSSGYLAFSAEL